MAEALAVPFKVTGFLEVGASLVPIYDHRGEICGYQLPNGKLVRLCLALEVEDPKETVIEKAFSYTCDSSLMEALGFNNIDYNETVFS